MEKLVKVATIFEISDDQLIAVEQLKLELNKHFPDMKLIKELTYKISHKSVAINGLLNLNKEVFEGGCCKRKNR